MGRDEKLLVICIFRSIQSKISTIALHFQCSIVLGPFIDYRFYIGIKVGEIQRTYFIVKLHT